MKVYLRTFGCRANHYDTEAVRELIERGGHSITESVADADAALFNSCTVTADAEADLRQAVRRAARDRPGLRSVIMGCAAALPDGARPPAARLAALPSVQATVGGADLSAVAAALDLPREVGAVRTHAQAGTRALLRVQDGCDEHCTFCATTLARGANRSRTAAVLVRETGLLAERHAEIVITGIHIGSYGVDIGTTLAALMERLVRDVPRVRFRLSSIEATEVDDRLAELFAAVPDRLAPHIHAPLQSGSDRLLRRMGRNWYTSAAYSRAIERLAARLPTFGLGADVIAGFPGETDADHRETLALIERLPFTYLHVFPYSHRPGTAAERIPGRVDPGVIRHRAAELRAHGDRAGAMHRQRRAGAVADVVATGRGPRPDGLTEDYLTVQCEPAAGAHLKRFAARLVLDGGRMRAVPIASA
ncbi:MAG: MiaB/RimO family radical SAM methylthiotransferase [Gemmatimonadales bacterium]